MVNKDLRKKKLLRMRRKIRAWGVSTGFLMPSLAGVLLFFFVPFLMLVKMSFTKSVTNNSFAGFENYEKVLTSDAFTKAASNTMLLSAMMVPVASIVLIWQVFFSYNGVLNGWFFQLFGADRIDWMKDDSGQIVIVLLFLWKNLGLNIIHIVPVGP